MKCPFCQQPNTQVSDSRTTEDGNCVRRRRRCNACGKRFVTLETLEVRLPDIVKSNGSRVPYNPLKLRTSLERALHKRPVGREALDGLVAEIEGRLYRLGRKEVPSRLIGEMAMDVLLATDQVAYVRFASVYKSFNDVSEFTQAIATLPEQQEGT
ncbi:transcriptional regulator NrdR [Neisseria sp. 23W00296]|uniref:transcriptional regulator NrdR n=1 Tax=unclassified Neisseria TaxID=2623750 RepID=UPI0002A1BE9D|nr:MULTISPECIES: transcriptional regulator NrdR [unclassified Neisseria]ASP16942.1 transcriptional regulator NrdR [Neisseria sp. KEM232]EKY03696.1 transcriptional regulator NrdR [Neisseria sp. oral taxon 020 str. F0370]